MEGDHITREGNTEKKQKVFFHDKLNGVWLIIAWWTREVMRLSCDQEMPSEPDSRKRGVSARSLYNTGAVD
jgi:hypothetical protein